MQVEEVQQRTQGQGDHSCVNPPKEPQNPTRPSSAERRLSNDLENMVKSVVKTFQGLTIWGTNMRDRILQPSKNNNGQTPKQGERKPFNKTPQTTPRVNDRGGQNGKMPGRDKQKDVSFKKPSDDKKGAPRANMVSDKEHVLAAKRYAGLHRRRSGTFNLYHTDDDQEIQEDTGYHS